MSKRSAPVTDTRSRRPTFRPLLEQLEDRAAPAVDTLVEPPVLQSINGVLDVTLTQQQGPAVIGGQQVTDAWTYNGSYVGPTLAVNPGDTMRIRLVNNLPGQVTNLHTHGLRVSQLGNGDNVFLQIQPQTAFDYEIEVPDDHPQGLYWYHPHHHGFVNDQIFKGLSGLIVIGRPDGGFPQLDGLRQRLLAINNTVIQNGSIPLPSSVMGPLPYTSGITTINGQSNPTLTIVPGQQQVLNVANVTNNAFYNLQLTQQGTGTAQTVYAVAEDGNPYTTAVPTTQLFLPPGKRFSFVVQGGPAGTYNLETTGFFDGIFTWPQAVLATVVSEGTPVTPAAPPTTLSPPTTPFEDLRNEPVAANRTVTFSRIAGQPPQFLINGATFPNNPVFQSRLNTVEQWTLTNQDNQDHPFHIHINDFQVISINGTAYNAQTEQDIINVAPGDSIVIRMKFRDFLGKYVYHCHRVDHEDDGMMATVNVVPQNPVLAVGDGGSGQVKLFNTDNTLKFSFMAFGRAVLGGVRVATGDVNGDGVDDVIVGQSARGSRVRVFSGQDLAVLFDFNAFEEAPPGGVSVAAGDVDGDKVTDVIVGAGRGVTPRVRAFSGMDGRLLADFLAYDAGFAGGVNVAAGDVNGDGLIDVVTGAGAGGGPHVKAFVLQGDHDALGLLTPEVEESFFAYDSSFTGGVYVATGWVQGIGFPDIITGAGAGGGPHVKAFDVLSVQVTSTSSHGSPTHAEQTAQQSGTPATVLSFFAYDSSFTGGVRVGSSTALVGDNLVVGAGMGGQPQVKIFDETNLLSAFDAFDRLFRRGVYVG